MWQNVIDFTTIAYIAAVNMIVLGLTGMLRDFGRGFLIVFSKKKYSYIETARTRKAIETVVKVSWLSGGAGIVCQILMVMWSMDLSGNLSWIGPFTVLILLSILYPILIQLILLTVRLIIEKKVFLQSEMSRSDVKSEAYEEYNLTERELEIVRMVVLGATNKEIADTLFIAVGTVKKHLTSIFEKLNVSGREQLRERLMEQG